MAPEHITHERFLWLQQVQHELEAQNSDTCDIPRATELLQVGDFDEDITHLSPQGPNICNPETPPEGLDQLIGLPAAVTYMLYNRSCNLHTRSYIINPVDVLQYISICRHARMGHPITNSPFPAEPLWLMNFVSELAGSSPIADIRKKLATLKSFHNDFGLGTEAFIHRLLGIVLLGIENCTSHLFPEENFV
jgi:hypothetical protein